ncbi:Hypothetical predicted protein [Paramuricea clavata]|uniref:Uncharacterized protein n=1 Tax=Paramuricea clavata TaxID=317549 RepID=A0A6S7HGD2_PARCT|nr:Hypothetical predicted protein [Paramuricea clavata]
MPDNGSSSETSGSEVTVGDMSTQRNALNHFLVVSCIDAITQSKKTFSELQPRTQNTHVTKASEAVAALLQEIDELDDREKIYLQALAETYEHATGWDTRRQNLSIMADLVPFSTLQKYLPGITKHRVKTARHHKELYGRGAPIMETSSTRMRVSPVQLYHFLTFITSPHVIQDLPFGHRNLQLSNGQVIETPNVIRTMIKQSTITQYVQYCEETDFKPYSTSTMNRILTFCSASVRKSLQGLDYISAEGGTGFDDLATITDKLIDYGLDPCNGQKLQKALDEGKQHFKTDFKVHVAQTSSTADHCLSLALSDSKGKGAAQAIESWKSHLLRSVQQDKARTDILELLDVIFVLITQDWAMKFLPQKLRETQPDCVALLCACPEISKHTGIRIKRVDFSDPQGGKGTCDRKAATVKGHVRRYINEGHDVATTEGFKDAILSHGGIHGVRVALVDNADCEISVVGKWDGISTLNNFSFDKDGKSIIVWKSYDVGEGRKTKFSSGDFVNIKFKKSSKNDASVNKNDDENVDEDEEVNTTSALFSCPSQGCILSFKRHSNLENHLLYGKCKRRREKFTLLDHAKILYSKKLSENTSTQTVMLSTTSDAQSTTALCQGWALRQTKKAARFNENQRSYIDEKFNIGLTSGIKTDPAQVARDLRHARNGNGDQRFTIDEFLTPQQIKSYFSRKAAKNRKSTKELNDNAVAAKDATAYCTARDKIIKEC